MNLKPSIQYALFIIVFNAIVMTLIYACDPNQDIRRTMMQQNKHAYRVFNACYATLAISFALSLRYFLSKSVFPYGMAWFKQTVRGIRV